MIASYINNAVAVCSHFLCRACKRCPPFKVVVTLCLAHIFGAGVGASVRITDHVNVCRAQVLCALKGACVAVSVLEHEAAVLLELWRVQASEVIGLLGGAAVLTHPRSDVTPSARLCGEHKMSENEKC